MPCADSGWEAGFHLATAVDNAFILGYAFLVRPYHRRPTCGSHVRSCTHVPHMNDSTDHASMHVPICCWLLLLLLLLLCEQ